MQLKISANTGAIDNKLRIFNRGERLMAQTGGRPGNGGNGGGPGHRPGNGGNGGGPAHQPGNGGNGGGPARQK